MDVRIAYGIDINEVPEKVIEMLNNIDTNKTDQLIWIAVQLMELADKNVPMAVDLIDQARVKLAAIDRILNDTHMILKGYVNTTEQEEAVQESPTPTTHEVHNVG